MAQVSELGEDVFGARTAETCGVRKADRGGSAECGRPVSAEPADVYGVRSADRVQSADCRLRGRPMSAECGTRSTAEYGVLLYNLGRQFYLIGRQKWEWLRFPTRPTRSAAALRRDGVRSGEVKTYKTYNRLAASLPPTRILERSLGTQLILQYT